MTGDSREEMSRGTSRLKIKRVSADKTERLEDVVVQERPATIVLNDTEIATPMCSPKDLDCLAVGFLYAEGLLKTKGEIRKLTVDDKDGVVWVSSRGKAAPEDVVSKRYITTGCGKGLTFVDASNLGRRMKVRSKVTIPASSVPSLMKDFLQKSKLHRITGGAHSAAICSPNKVLVFNEDIGRHSAIDKVVGKCILDGVRMKDRILVTTGRVSSDILIKAARSGIPIIISKSAPTDLAVQLAEEFGITLVGFARGSRMNVYSGGQRISVRPAKKNKGAR